MNLLERLHKAEQSLANTETYGPDEDYPSQTAWKKALYRQWQEVECIRGMVDEQYPNDEDE